MAIQRLVSEEGAICRELSERATATAFTQFARQVRRFYQRIQAGSSRGYIPERIERTRISNDFGNATDAKGDYRFSIYIVFRCLGRSFRIRMWKVPNPQPSHTGPPRLCFGEQ